MQLENPAFDDFVDDCFIDKDPLCNLSREKSIELIPSQIIEQLVRSDDQDSLVT